MIRNLPHLKIPQPTQSINFIIPNSGGGGQNFPKRNRVKHGNFLKKKLEQAWNESKNEVAVSHLTREGIFIEFQSAPGFDIQIKSLEDFGKDIRLCNVREETALDSNKKTIFVTVHVPKDQISVLFKKIDDYLKKNTKKGNPSNKNLIEGIENIKKAIGDSFWVDDKALIPKENKEWCEVWLRENPQGNSVQFSQILNGLDINSKPSSINFPERTVKLIFVSYQDLNSLILHSDEIAEFRKAKSTADFLLSESPTEQSVRVENLLQRVAVSASSNIYICLLDTGVNWRHPLIDPILRESDCQAVIPLWGVDDHKDHGTLMSGISGYGDLQFLLESSGPVSIKHRLESVKILPPNGQNNKELWGDYTKQGISKAEINEVSRKRIFCMPISSDDTSSRGRPTSWSAAIDQLTYGENDGNRRLMIVSAGNSKIENWKNYPNSVLTDPVEDPGQSWNALTVGAITNLQQITDPGHSSYSPVASEGELSPHTTTSLTWDEIWPAKPEIVFEGGNLGKDNMGFSTQCNDLSLVSTYYRPADRLFEYFYGTSASTAQAAHFAAMLRSEYPDYWPETIRGLMVHSSRWPDALTSKIWKMKKKELEVILRSFGYGKPDLEQALYCASNSLTLVSEAEIQPFEKAGSNFRTKDMHLYELPWPRDILENLGEEKVEMRVTLSYFIEPGPGELGWKDRYRYPSHGLRFELNSPGEDSETFLKRINKRVRENEEDRPDSSSPSNHWLIGIFRNKGSIHSDIWNGTAAELARSNLIGISPRVGWWRERKNLNKYNQKTRYSLIVSISTPKSDVDIYSPVEVSLSTQITI